MAAPAAFFALCAWAQLNDPDPILWAGFYLLGGSALAIAPLACGGHSIHCLASATLVLGAALLAHAAALLVPKVQWQQHGARELCWELLTHEEGSEKHRPPSDRPLPLTRARQGGRLAALRFCCCMRTPAAVPQPVVGGC